MSEETEDERWERLSRDRIHRPLPKRFYKSVAVTDRLGIALDGRTVKTPLKAALVLPNQDLAEAEAAEWDAQVDVINPHAMPLTKLANTAIDRATTEKAKIAAEILEFAGSDHCRQQGGACERGKVVDSDKGKGIERCDVSFHGLKRCR